MLFPRSVFVRTRLSTAGIGASRARVTLLFSLTALALGGCSAAAPMANSGLISAFASQPPPRATQPVDLEADGMEAQRPPRMRMFSRPDDPTQPFSPNYGEVPLPQQDEGEDAPPAPA